MNQILEKLRNTHEASSEELLYILDHVTKDSMELLFAYSHQVRVQYYGHAVYMRGLIEFSNYCKQNCAYCGIQSANQGVDRYRLHCSEILDCCKEGYRLGYRTFVLQSGEDPYYTDERMEEIVMSIKTQYPDCAITLSIGERSYECYQKLFEAGADRYLLRHETASQSLYESLHPTMDYDHRRHCLYMLKKIGYQVGAGFMVGLPGQSNQDLVEDLLFLKELQPDMVGIGPFIPHPSTPLSKYSGGTLEKTLIMVALTRLLLPDALLPATTALGSMDPKGREQALKVGANVVMPNLSPLHVRPKYELYEGKICTGDEAAHCRSCIQKRIESAGFAVNMERGDSLQWRRNQNVY